MIRGRVNNPFTDSTHRSGYWSLVPLLENTQPKAKGNRLNRLSHSQSKALFDHSSRGASQERNIFANAQKCRIYKQGPRWHLMIRGAEHKREKFSETRKKTLSGASLKTKEISTETHREPESDNRIISEFSVLDFILGWNQTPWKNKQRHQPREGDTVSFFLSHRGVARDFIVELNLATRKIKHTRVHQWRVIHSDDWTFYYPSACIVLTLRKGTHTEFRPCENPRSFSKQVPLGKKTGIPCVEPSEKSVIFLKPEISPFVM